MKSKNYKIDLEIYIVFIAVIGISVFNAIYSSFNISRNQDVTTKIMTVEIPSLQSLENMNLLVTRAKMYTTNWVYLQGNKEDKEKLKELQSLEYPELKGNILALMSMWSDQGNADSMQQVFLRFEKMMVFQKQIMATLVDFDDYEDPMKKFAAEEIIENEILPGSTNLITELNQVILKKKAQADFEHNQMRASSRALMWSVLGIAILIVMVVLMAAFYMSNNIIVPTMKLKNYILMMGKGEIPEMELEPRKNAVGQMTEAVRTLMQSLRRTARFAHNIGDGNFSVEFQPLGENDELGNALVQMRSSLHQADIDNKQRNWISSGIEQINGVLRENNDDISRLSDEIISTLVSYISAFHGAIYLLETNEFDNRSWVALYGSYALDERAKAKKRIEIGEGLVGQAVKQGTPIYLMNAPSAYATINSGLGESPASHVVIIPLKHHGTVYGAIELASFAPFEHHKQDFIENIGETIASTVASVKANTLTRKLLDETKKQAERLSAQEEELRQTNEELYNQSKLLQASEEELKQSNLELKQNTRELEHQNEILEQAREALSLKAKELELNSKYKSEFLANMSHELRTPLNSVLILAKLLSENKASNLNEKQVEYARVIHKSGTDLLVLINDILDLSKIEAGKVELIFEETELKIVKNDIQSLFSELANEKKIEFEIEQHSNLPDRFITDRIRLEQIIKNMLSNAFKFTPQGGKISLRIKQPDRNVKFTNPLLLNSNHVIEFSVSDTGIGIPLDKQQLIFEAFQQADGSTNRKFGGTGLGLSISKMLVAMLGGEMQLVSEQGKGSTFSMYLPLDANQIHIPASSQIPSENRDGNGREIVSGPVGEKVYAVTNEAYLIPDDRDSLDGTRPVLLIVEDDVQFARILLDMAHEKSYQAVVATHGDVGLRFAEEINPTAIIMDMQLPGMDGWSILKRIRENEKIKHIPIHIMSAMDRQKLGLEMGATEYLRKPLDKKDLDQAFQNIDKEIEKEIRKVLIVEDTTIQQEIIQNLLLSKHKKTKIFTADTATKASEILETERFDCIIMDLDLGNGQEEGISLLEKIKSTPSHASTPVIVFTGTDVNEEQEHYLKKLSQAIVLKSGPSIERLIEETGRFLISIKENSEEQTGFKIPVQMENLLHGRHVLLVDDDMRNIYALSSVLENNNMNVITATNGRDALSKLGQHPEIEIILMDIMMPEMDGYQAMQEIRKDKKVHSLPIIALTAKAMVGDREKCIQCGASDYISKPVNTEQLLSLMRVWLYKG
ncbi:MAG TPA: response regulator [Bacteroidia bacterium]|nr:response regulator [Bacteroidia bacterium]